MFACRPIRANDGYKHVAKLAVSLGLTMHDGYCLKGQLWLQVSDTLDIAIDYPVWLECEYL
jgi:hypothetical protein